MNFQVDVLVSELQTIEICFVFEGDYPACVSVFCIKQNKTKKIANKQNVKTQSITATTKTLFSTFFTW